MNTQAPLRTGIGKYKSLIISIAVFIVIIISVLAINFYADRLTVRNTVEVEASSKMRDQVQSVTRDLFDMRLSYGENPFNPNIKATIERLRSNTQALDNSITTFQQGGLIAMEHGSTVQVSPPKDPRIRQALARATAEWEPLRSEINNYLASVFDRTVDETPLDIAINQAQTSSIIMYEAIDDLAVAISSEAAKRSQLVSIVQILGIGIAILYFVIFIFFFVRRLRRADAEAEEARQETNEIMETIHEGLFLIDEHLQIGQQTSNELSRIVPGQEFSGQQLENVLSQLVEQKDIENARRFIKQLFNERVDEKLIGGLNPLQRVAINLSKDGEYEIRYIRFIFTRVWEDDAIKRVLVSVTDISDAVRLEKRLEKERLQNEQQIELLLKVLRISPPLLASFLRNAHQLTHNVNDALKRSGKKVIDMKATARNIYRDIHGFKGEASALGLESFVSICETIENRLKYVLDKPDVSGNDFLQVTIALDSLINKIHDIDNLQANLKITENSDVTSNEIAETTATDDIDQLRSYYQSFAKSVAERNGKSANLIINNYDRDQMDDLLHDDIKEIILQLIRNAVFHGIESPNERLSLDKLAAGQLTLSLNKTEQSYTLTFADDGAGIDYESLRKKLKEMSGSEKAANIDNMSHSELNKYIFTSGLSTAHSANTDAGRGMGMDVIKEKLRRRKGKISIQSEAESGTKFAIRFPEQP